MVYFSSIKGTWKNGEQLNSEDYINGIKLSSPAGVYVRWLEGLSDNATKNHITFDNPLNGVSCENKWDNIWEN